MIEVHISTFKSSVNMIGMSVLNLKKTSSHFISKGILSKVLIYHLYILQFLFSVQLIDGFFLNLNLLKNYVLNTSEFFFNRRLQTFFSQIS